MTTGGRIAWRSRAGHTLFTRALRVISEAIEAHKDASPWREIIARTTALERPLTFGVAIYEGDEGRVVDQYGVRAHDGRFEVLEHGHLEPTIDWRVSVDELRQIVAKPDRYIEDPGRLDLAWLQKRLAIGPEPKQPSGWRVGRARRPS